MMRRALVGIGLGLPLVLFTGCGGGDSATGSAGTGGFSFGFGGGGDTGTAGDLSNTGGVFVGGGGDVSTGGASGIAGSLATGGATSDLDGGTPSDGSVPEPGDSGASTGGALGSGGTNSGGVGNGGASSTGGASSGGADNGGTSSGNGGASSTGGASSGGANNGGTSSTGGASNGGADNGGASNGGVDNGGASNGGADNGGASSTGGASNGGASSTGGASNGGADNGGASSTGGASNGGADNGGASSTGGASNGGADNGGTSNGGAGGDGLDGGEAPFVPTGPALTGTDKVWKYISFPDTKCRDGSAAGVSVSLNSASKKVMVYLEGGGACFDALTCGANAANVVGQTGAQTAGIFDRTNNANPVKDWNYVYVPYCTGDVHAGTNDNGTVAGVLGTQHFVGRNNLQAFLNRIVPTFPTANQVLLTGVSAGGFGAAGNAQFVQWAFGDVPVNLIDDSGPPMSSTYLPACLQDEWRTLWGLDGSILKDCGADCPSQSDFLMDYALHLGKRFDNRDSGLIETTDDAVITSFYGYGMNNCTGSVFTPVSAVNFQAGLLDFRTQIDGVDSKFGTYYITGTTHTWLGGAAFYTEKVTGSESLVDWTAGIVNGTGAPNIGP